MSIENATCLDAAKGLDSHINCYFASSADTVENILFYSFDITLDMNIYSVPLLLLWLAAAAILFTLYFNFINFRFFRHAFDIVRGKYDEPGEQGQISSSQALAASLSGTVGLGNIAGVAVAISIGGPGATIWMIVMGLLAMSTKFIEVTLGVKYRQSIGEGADSSVFGGPMYYLKHGLKHIKIPYLATFLSCLFAVCAIAGAVGGGNMFQANQAYIQVVGVTGGEHSFLADKGWAFGLFLAFITGLVIVGGIKSIGRVASKIVPLMGFVYLFAGLVVIALSYDALPHAVEIIFKNAFTSEAGFGGILGGMLVGIQRAAFSNEAGLGSAAVIHASARTKYPVRQGIAGMMGPFIDTVIICTVTALVIVVSGVYQDVDGMAGVDMTSKAFAEAISWFPYLLAVAVFLFAYSTLITWSYIGEKATNFLFGEGRLVSGCYKIMFLIFVVLGCSADLDNLIRLSDAMILSMAIPNIIGLYLMAPIVKRDLKDYVDNFFTKEGNDKS